MERPVQITFRGMAASDAVAARIRDKVARLERMFDRIIGCHVVVDAPHNQHRKGNLFTVSIELRLPGGPPLVVTTPHHDAHEHEDVYVAIRDAFAAARRRLGHRVAKRADHRAATL